MNARPIAKKIEDIDVEYLIRRTEEYLDFIENDYLEDNDEKQYLYENLLETIYGPKIWDFIKSRI